MMVVFVRHGEKRRTESDPGLTSAGRRMAFETGLWIREQGWMPALFVTTPTQRTRQTTEELRLALISDPEPDPASPTGTIPVEERDLPELGQDLDDMLEVLARRRLDTIVCVGHHPTIDLLKRRYTPPVVVPRANSASAIALRVEEDGAVSCVAAWPGRPSF